METQALCDQGETRLDPNSPDDIDLRVSQLWK